MDKPPVLLLSNARLALLERTSAPASLLVEDGLITRILSSQISESVKADQVFDLNGASVLPGFIDVHIHGAVGVDTMDTESNDLIRVGKYLASKGVTAWMPTLVPSSQTQYEKAVHAIAEAARLNSFAHARVLGVHYEGPFVSSEQCGALHRERFRRFTGPDDLDSLPTLTDPNAVHMMTLAPEIEGAINLIKELGRRGWIISIGHTRARADVLDEARDAGARHMTHFMNAMPPLHHRAPGPVGWGLLNDQVTLDVIADGVHLDPSMLKVLLRCVTPSRMTLISDAIAAAGRGDGDYEIWGEKISVVHGRTRNAHGNIAGSVITMFDAVRMMLSLGVSECDVARMASLNPARLLGIEKECGSIEEGKRADLVAFDTQAGVKLTLVGGRVAFDANRMK